MSDENKNYGGLRLRTDDTKETVSTTEHTENNQSINQGAFDDTNLNFDDNVYFQKTKQAAQGDNTYHQRDIKDNGIKYKGDRPNWTFILFVVIGIIIIFVQINTIRDMALMKRLEKSGQSVRAQITDVDRHYHRRSSNTYSLYVDYEVDGHIYKHVYIGKTRRYIGKGGYVTVYYDERNPKKVFSNFASTQNKVNFFIRWCILAIIILMGYHAYKNPDEVSKSMMKGFTAKKRRW